MIVSNNQLTGRYVLWKSFIILEEAKAVKRTIPHIVLLLMVLLFVGNRRANAQNASVYFGLGTATDSANSQPIDTFGNGIALSPPKMGGLFETFGGDFMFRPHLGFGVETTFQGQRSYAGLNYRPLFYDFNAVYEPISVTERIVPEFQAGLGGVNLRFYYPQSFCDMFVGCSNSNQYLESSNHFQLHFAAGVKVYVQGGFFVKPQVDAHWVNNFFQFGGSWVPQYSVAVGYTFGRSH